MNADNTTELKRWVVTGLVDGAKLGVLLSTLWVCLLAVVDTVSLLKTEVTVHLSASELNPDRLEGAIFAVIVTFGLHLIVGTLNFVAPMLITGGAAGMLLGAALHFSHIAPYRWNRLAVGGGIGLLLLSTAHSAPVLALMDLDTNPPANLNHFAYYTLWGGPWLVFTGACVWLSDRFPALVKAQYTVKEIPAHLPTPAIHQDGN